MENPSPKSPGCQPGNTNALKHGFYSKRFPPSVVSDLDSHSFSGLKDEAILLRVFIRQLADQAYEANDLQTTLDLVRTLSLASATLTRMLKTQALVFNDHSDEVRDALRQALAEVNAEPPPHPEG